MKTVTIDGLKVQVNGEKNLLEVIRKAGIDLPTFCYHSELSVYGACRMCLVELGDGRIVASCSTPPEDGMEVKTMTPQVQKIRKISLELLLANHDRECTSCEKSGSCRLQDLAQRFGIREVRFGSRKNRLPLDESSVSVVRDPNKCILCGDCVRMCKEVQGVGVLDFAHRGANVQVSAAFGKPLSEVECVNCGQCSAVCPTGAIVVKSDIPKVWEYIHDPNQTVVVQIAPAVRVAIGESFGMQPGEQSLGKLAAALRRLGFDKVFDTSFAADLTVMEETTEFLNRLRNGESIPQFTSCCPAWVKYCEQFHPELLGNLSTCRSPQQMFGSAVKKYYARLLGLSPSRLKVVSLMPCTAKKFEAQRPEFRTGGVPDVDVVLTTQEVIRMIREAGLNFRELEEDSLDMPFGFTSGAGVIFGVTGGVSEAVLRSAHFIAEKRDLEEVVFEEVRGMAGLKSAEAEIGGKRIRVAVVHGLNNAEKLIKSLQNGGRQFDLIEVMACPGGCVGGAGQPQSLDSTKRTLRARGLYAADKTQQLRRSHDNPLIGKLYEAWLEKPNSHIAHEALHTHYFERRRISGTSIAFESEGAQHKLDVSVCVGTCCYLRGSYDVLQELGRRISEAGIEDIVNLNATFCFENCCEGCNVKIGDQVFGGVSMDTVDSLWMRIMGKLVVPASEAGSAS